VGKVPGELHARWALQGETFAARAAALQAQWPTAVCQIQKSNLLLELPLQHPTTPASTPQPARVRAVQTGWLRHGTRGREITYLFIPHSWPHSSVSII
jgi:hypothetical protein